jgi:hypothetical protein
MSTQALEEGQFVIFRGPYKYRWQAKYILWMYYPMKYMGMWTDPRTNFHYIVWAPPNLDIR